MAGAIVTRIAFGLALLFTLVRLGPAQMAPKTTLAEMTGPDDGYGLSIQASGDFAGNFEPCGCKIPLGGLARRVGYARAIEAQSGGKAVVLQVDAGRLFAGAPGPGYAIVDDLAVKNEWVLRAAEAIDLRAANVTAYDLAVLAPLMAKDGFDARVKQYPILDRFISANVVPSESKARAFKPYVIVEVRSERFGAKPLRVGILGVTEVPLAGSKVAGYDVTDPIAAIAKYASEVRSKSDVFVILGYLDQKTVRAIEPVAGAVDALISAHQNTALKFDGVVDTPAIVFAPNLALARTIGEIRYYPATDAKAKRYSKVALRYVVLNPLIPDDPAAAQVTRDAVKAFRKV